MVNVKTTTQVKATMARFGLNAAFMVVVSNLTAAKINLVIVEIATFAWSIAIRPAGVIAPLRPIGVVISVLPQFIHHAALRGNLAVAKNLLVALVFREAAHINLIV